MKKNAIIIPICIAVAAIAAFVIAISIMTNLVFTSKRLTEIANKAADSVIVAPHRFDNVELTFWRTFPHFGFKVNNLTIGSPTEDTLAYIPELVVTLNFQKYFDNDIVEINNIAFKNGHINLHVNEEGEGNWHILKANQAEKIKKLPFKIGLQHIDIAHLKTSFIDDRDSIRIIYARIDIDAIARTDQDYSSMTFDDCHLVMEYDSIVAEIRANASFSDTIGIHFDQFDFGIYDLNFSVKGNWLYDTNSGNTYSDLTFNADDWKISKFLNTLRKPIWKHIAKAERTFRCIQDSFPEKLVGDAVIDLYVHTYGSNDSASCPMMDISLNVNDMHGHYDYDEIPYKINRAYANISSHIDFSNLSNSSINIRDITAYISKHDVNMAQSGSRVTLKGKLTDLFPTGNIEKFNPETDISCQIKTNINEHVDSTRVTGSLLGNINDHNRWDNLLKHGIDSLHCQAHFDINDLQIAASDRTLFIPQCNINISNDLATDRDNLANCSFNCLAFNTDTDCLNMTKMAGIIKRHRLSGQTQYLMEWNAENLQWYSVAENDTLNIQDFQCKIIDKTEGNDISKPKFSIEGSDMEQITQMITTIYADMKAAICQTLSRFHHH